jgi:peptidoglycan hydrolase-like protein with peptidoglycan-binding domain
VKPVIVVHTAESGTDRVGSDPKAERTANFIRNRTTAGSYHLLGDADSIIQLVRFDNEAFHDRTGSNRWAIGISLAMNAGDWGSISIGRRNQLIDTAAQMAAIAANWLGARGLPFPEARLLTKSESDRSTASGFISHARRDPTRRSDPGSGFPWTEFFRLYRQKLSDGGFEPSPDQLTRELQLLIGTTPDGIVGPRTIAAMNRNWLGADDSFDPSVADTFTNNPRVIEWVQARANTLGDLPVVVDGEYGPATAAALKALLNRGGVVTAESFIALLDVDSDPDSD